SVPYALHAKTSENGIDRISMDGDTLYLTNGEEFVSTNSQSPNLLGLAIPTINISVLGGGSNSCRVSLSSVSNVNSSQIIERGIIYSTTPSPKAFTSYNGVSTEIGVSIFSLGDGVGLIDTIIGSFQSELLMPNTTYYARAFVYTENGLISYSNEVSITTEQIGYIGPAGGVVFYDKGDTIGGWRYLEVATFDQSAGVPWGCPGTYLGTGEQEDWDIGYGEINTAQIVAGCNESSYAAKICSDLVLGGQDDWFLPSINELHLFHINNAVVAGDYIEIEGYWVSNEDNTDNFTARTGTGGTFQKTEQFKVRAIRAY
ncbi:MAG: hypothetical protein ACKOYC_10470, partial [Bacteroidota bacterium]